MEFGWSAPFGSMGGGGGVLSPPDPSEQLQRLYSNDGSVVLDRLVVATEPDIVDVSCIICSSGNNAVAPVALDYGTDDYEIIIDFKHVTVAGTQYLLDSRDANDIGVRVALVSNTLYLSHNTHDITFTAVSVDGLWHTATLTKTGTTLSAVLDQRAPIEITSVTDPLIATTLARLGSNGSGTEFLNSGFIANVSASERFDYSTEEGGGTVLYDRSVLENDATLSSELMWVQEDGPICDNALNGFSLYKYIVLLLATIAPLDLIPDLTQIPI